MAWRTVVISKPAKLKVENDQLAIIQEETVRLPLEDIAVLLLETHEVNLNAAVLDRIAQHGGSVIVCDSKHTPSFAGLPMVGNSRAVSIQRVQFNTSLPFRKRCWQTLIKQKITNQAKCLELIGNPKHKLLANMVDDVMSGDGTNVESIAAREYFREAFHQDFTRDDEVWVNSALNYGYAIIRGAVARALVLYGFHPMLGVHHRSELNPFNLADDIFEPLRPVVDLAVANMPEGESLTKQDREQLVSLLSVDVLIEGKRYAVLRAVEIMAASFQTACKRNEPKYLKLPELLPIAVHQYE